MSALTRPLRAYMASPLRTIALDASAADATRLLRRHEISCLAVLGRDGRPAGLVTRTDLLQAARPTPQPSSPSPRFELPDAAVGDLMTTQLVVLSPEASIAAAARALVEQRIHRLFVGDRERLAGVISTKEIMRAVLDARLSAALTDYMSRPIEGIDVREALIVAVDRLKQTAVAGLVVIEAGLPVGLFTQREALEATGLPATTMVEDVMTQAMVALPQTTPLFRAAGFTLSTRARRVLAVEHHHVRGIVTGRDFARAVADTAGPDPVAATA